MNIFKRILGKQEKPTQNLQESVETLCRFNEDIRKHYGEPELSNDPQAIQVLAVYVFGGVSALAMQRRMNPTEAHAVCLAVYTGVFNFAEHDAATKAQAVITATPDKTSHLYGIIHRGAGAFVQWQAQRDNKAAEDFAEAMKRLKHRKE